MIPRQEKEVDGTVTDNELLQAIDKMLDTKIQPIRADIAEVQKKMDSLETRVASLETKVDGLETRVASLETKIDGLETCIINLEDKTDNLQSDMQVVKTKVTSLELTLENRTNHNIQLIAENHMSLVDKLNQAIQVSDKTLLYEVQVSSLQYKVEKLEKEVATIKDRIA